MLDLDLFAKNKAKKDGLQNYCRKCGYEASKKYASTHKKEAVQRSLRYKANNPEKVRLSRAKTRIKRVEYDKAYRQKYAIHYRHRHAERMHVRRARMQNNGVFLITNKELKRLYGGSCFYCHKVGKMTIDHVVPISRGGRHSIGNLVSACKPCNSSKHDKFITEWQGLISVVGLG